MSQSVFVMGCEDLCVSVGILSLWCFVYIGLGLSMTSNLLALVRRVANILNKHTVLTIVFNLLTTTKLVVYSLKKSGGLSNMVKRYLVACIMLGGVLHCIPAAALVQGQACPTTGFGSWYVYQCNCANDGRHWMCNNSPDYLEVNGQTTCYITRADGGADDEATWICAKERNGSPCTVCKCPQSTGWEVYPGDETSVVKYTYNNVSSSYLCDFISRKEEYGCNVGYYEDGSNWCVDCPSYGGISGTNEIGTTAKATCYIPPNVTGNDGAGTFTYVAKCNWSGS